MYLVYGFIVLFAVVLFWSAALIVCKRPDPGWYGKEFMQAYFWAPLASSGLLLGVLMIVRAFIKFSPSILELILSAIIFAVTVGTYRLLSKWVPPIPAAVEGTETKIIPFGEKDRAKTPAPDLIKPLGTDLKKAA